MHSPPQLQLRDCTNCHSTDQLQLVTNQLQPNPTQLQLHDCTNCNLTGQLQLDAN